MKYLKAVVTAVLSLALSASLALAAASTTLTADQAYALLKGGNAKFVTGRLTNLAVKSQPSQRIISGVNGQNPW